MTAGALLVVVPWLLFAISVATIAVLVIHLRPACQQRGKRPDGGRGHGRGAMDEHGEANADGRIGQSGPPGSPRRP